MESSAAAEIIFTSRFTNLANSFVGIDIVSIHSKAGALSKLAKFCSTFRSFYRLSLWARRCLVRATFLACCCIWLQAGSRNQTSNAAHDWLNLASSRVIVVRAVARAVGTRGANAIASITNAAAEIVIAIFLNITNRPVKRPAHAGSGVYSARRPRAK
jgi:hypothetical protein